MVTRVLGLDEAPEAGRRRRRAGAGHLPRLARPGPAAAARRSAGRRHRRADPAPHAAALDGGRPMIASVNGRVAAVSPDGAVVEVGGVGLAVSVHARHDRPAAGGGAGPAVDQPGRARGLAHALRLRRRRRARACSSCCRPRTAWAPGSPRRCWPSTRRARSAAPSRWATSRRSCRCPASAARAPSGWSSSCATGSGPRRRTPPLDGPSGLPSVTAVAPWRDQLTSALVGLGWTAREADGAVGQLAPVADEQIAATGTRRGRRAAAAGPAAAGPGR